MPINLVCEHCGKRLTVEEYLAGQSIECYLCHQPVVIPQEGEIAIIEFQCLGCGTEFRVPASRAGGRTRCPKCRAVLAVPEAGSTGPLGASTTRPARPGEAISEMTYEVAPPSATTKGLSVKVTAPSARYGVISRRAPYQPGGLQETEPAAAPRPGTSVGPIILWVCLGLFVLIAIYLVSTNRGGGGGRGARNAYVELQAKIKYNKGLDVFQVVNATSEGWTDITLTIETGSGSYFFRAGGLSPGDPLVAHGSQFVNNAGHAFNGATMTWTRFIITARLPSGRTGRSVRVSGGAPSPAAP